LGLTPKTGAHEEDLLVSSQRVREDHILQRLHAGVLPLATASDTVQPAPIAPTPCHGCLEPETDVRVGERSWHALCALFWQGRSESARGQAIPHIQPGPGISPARPRWVIVVPIGQAETYGTLRHRFERSPWVDVVMDRRRGERRQETGTRPPVERRIIGPRRTGERRPPSTPDPGAGPVFRLAHRGADWELYESTEPERGRCPECDAVVTVEVPLFAEPPMRFELLVRHEPASPVARHVVDLQSFLQTGRVLMATRLIGRTQTDSP
jgi:hypothetical protein